MAQRMLAAPEVKVQQAAEYLTFPQSYGEIPGGTDELCQSDGPFLKNATSVC